MRLCDTEVVPRFVEIALGLVPGALFIGLLAQPVRGGLADLFPPSFVASSEQTALHYAHLAAGIRFATLLLLSPRTQAFAGSPAGIRSITLLVLSKKRKRFLGTGYGVRRLRAGKTSGPAGPPSLRKKVRGWTGVTGI